MLTHLSIQNFSLIDQIELSLEDGLTVITGETGAGKSILLGALSMILGERMDHSALKDKTKKCIIEGKFLIEGYQLKALFEELDLDYEPLTILRREISPQGKSRNFINDSPTKLEAMKKVGSQLIDIHSQHQSLQINHPQFQLEVIDSLANHSDELSDYQAKYEAYSKLRKQFEQRQKAAVNSRNEEDFIQFQLHELAALNLQEGEGKALEKEQKLYANSEAIMRSLSLTQQILSGGEPNALSLIASIDREMDQLASYLHEMIEIQSRFNQLRIELNDLSAELEQIAEEYQYDPERHRWVDERMNEVNRLLQKHQLREAEDLSELKKQLQQKLDGLTNAEEGLNKMERELLDMEKVLKQGAEALSFKRKKVLPKLEKELSSKLKSLGIPYPVFKVRHQKNDRLGRNGMDEFEFLFSANKGVSPQRIAKTASGGEISRLMLSLKQVVAKSKQMPTLIFDEIDAGVSGEIADRMGEVLFEISKQAQLIAITHLPQLAAKGNNHLFVFKNDQAGMSQTKIKVLNTDERLMEVAKMLSGKKMSQAAINNAKELLSI